MTLSYTLSDHPRGYDLKWYEVLYGLVVSPYGLRHLEKAEALETPSEKRLGHHLIALLELIPALGAIASAIERFVVAIFYAFFYQPPAVALNKTTVTPPLKNKDVQAANENVSECVKKGLSINSESTSSFTPPPSPEKKSAISDPPTQTEIKIEPERPVTPPEQKKPKVIKKLTWEDIQPYLPAKRINLKEAEQLMSECFREAIHEKRRKPGKDYQSFVPDYFDYPPMPKHTRGELSFHHDECESIGGRSEEDGMEDAHFYVETKTGDVLCGVFDGHGDDGKIAKFSANYFKNHFEEVLKLTNHVHEALVTITNKIHAEVRKRYLAGKVEGGCTALICYIDKKKRKLYTAALADTEGRIYRTEHKNLVSIPLTPVRNWNSPEDEKRALEWYDKNRPDLKQAFVMLGKKSKGIGKKKVEDENTEKSRRFPGGNLGGINVSRSIGDNVYEPAVSHDLVISMHHVEHGDCLVLGCDGAWDYVDEKKMIKKIIEPNIKDRQVNLSEKILNHALDDCGSEDNVTVLTVRIH